MGPYQRTDTFRPCQRPGLTSADAADATDAKVVQPQRLRFQRRRGWRNQAADHTLLGKEILTAMGPDDIIERIRAHSEAIRSLGATALYIYGSRARGEALPDSDLDVFVDFDPGRFSFVELVELEDMLSRELGLKVQLATHDALHPLMRTSIERDAIRVF
jgi:uncharacterized protein